MLLLIMKRSANTAFAAATADGVDLSLQASECAALDLKRATAAVSTGIGFLDHMLDQFYSHAQIGIDLQITSEGTTAGEDTADNHNRHADRDQKELLSLVGTKVGKALKQLLDDKGVKEGAKSKFACPLDEALTVCRLERCSDSGELKAFTLSPYGKFPATGRTHIGKLETASIESFWQCLAKESTLLISLEKIRGDNAHHIVESCFKAFARALRNLLDGIDTETDSSERELIYGRESDNCKAGIAMQREGSVTRKTKETSISTLLKFDGGATGVSVCTGVSMLDHFFTELAKAADISLNVECQGDLWIDEHHTAEDVAIAVGQALTQALGTKAGLNRMWCAISKVGNTEVEVTMDLSNRPCFTHNLSLDAAEKVGDLSLEMFEHVLDSVVVNGRMTVHVCELASNTKNLKDTVTATAQAFGQALKYCAMIDGRRAGATASSKGTLSV